MILETAVNAKTPKSKDAMTGGDGEGKTALNSLPQRVKVPGSLSPCVLAPLRLCFDSTRSVSGGVQPIRVLFSVLGNLSPDRFQRGLRFPSPNLRGPA